MATPAFEEVGFSEAKKTLSEVMTQVVQRHAPMLVRRHGKETMLLIKPEDLAASLSLAGFRYDPQLIFDEGEVTARLEPFGVLGFGATAEEAMADLASELDAYATRFYDEYEFYSRTDRRSHAPYLLRFKLTPRNHQVELLYEDSRSRYTPTS